MKLKNAVVKLLECESFAGVKVDGGKKKNETSSKVDLKEVRTST